MWMPAAEEQRIIVGRAASSGALNGFIKEKTSHLCSSV